MSKLRLSGATSGYEEIKTADTGDNNTYQVGSTVTAVDVTASGTIQDAQGNVRALQVTIVNSTPYTVASGSSGKYFGLGTGSSVVTINNSNFAVGDIITIYNRLGTDATINFSGFTLAHIAGDGTNKTSVTLVAYGLCTLIYDRSGHIIINGNVS
jgi:hypothetical protein